MYIIFAQQPATFHVLRCNTDQIVSTVDIDINFLHTDTVLLIHLDFVSKLVVCCYEYHWWLRTDKFMRSEAHMPDLT